MMLNFVVLVVVIVVPFFFRFADSVKIHKIYEIIIIFAALN